MAAVLLSASHVKQHSHCAQVSVAFLYVIISFIPNELPASEELLPFEVGTYGIRPKVRNIPQFYYWIL